MYPKIVACEGIPEDTILLIPPVTLNRYINLQTGEVKEYFSFNPAAAGMISNVKI